MQERDKAGEKRPGYKEERGKANFIVTNLIRIVLVAALLFGFFEQRNLILAMAAFGLFLTFIPLIFDRAFKINIPAGFEILTLLFIYGLLYFGEVKGYYDKFWVLDVMLNFVLAIILGLVGLAFLYSLYKEEKVQGNPFVIAFFAFCFAVAVGALWEAFEFALDSSLNFQLQKGSFDTMKDIVINIIGAGIVSWVGYFYIKSGKSGLVSNLIGGLIHKNASRFGLESERHTERTKEKTRGLIRDGENGKVEFKSTLRTNVHTGQVDKGIELAAMKTMAGYLNSDGGTLLIGVGNDREIVGLNKDGFESHDRLALHLTNLIKEHIGPEFLPFIDFNIVDVDEKHVLKIDCKKSNKEVFTKVGKEEHFYVRNGPSTATLTGSSLVEYITNRFR